MVWRKERDSNPRRPRDRFALAGRRHEPLGHPSMRAPYRTRTGDLRLDGAASTPTGPTRLAELGTRRGIRTHNPRGLSAVPLPIELPGLGGARTACVDRKGVEPFTRGLQGDAVHRHSAHVGVTAALGAEDSNLHERVQSPSGCRVASAPKDCPRWSGHRESNSGVRRGGATHFRCATAASWCCVDRAGFEPAVSRLRAWRDRPYSNGPYMTSPRPASRTR